MSSIALPPAAGESVDVHADWIEWELISNRRRFLSWVDYVRHLRLSTSKSELSDETGVADDPHEALIDDIVSEIQARQVAAENGYPFMVTQHGLARVSATATQYEFMLALTLFGINAGPRRSFPERAFEDMCGHALAAYLGRPALGVQYVVFGFPRRMVPRRFSSAVLSLCRSLGEGVGCMDEPDAAGMKDAALDVVAWRGFPDRRGSQLIVFGQCSSGDDWRDKLTTLQPRKWCQLWMKEMPRADPTAAFFVPRMIETRLLRQAAVQGGILFDRCRIAWLVSDLDHDLLDRMRRWTSAVMERGLPSAA